MIAKYAAKRQKKTSGKVRGLIASANDHSVTVKLPGNVASYRKGQRVVVGIPYRRKTALGKDLEVSKIVAHGEIVDISRDEVTIQSNRTNPLISRSALHENEGKERFIIVESVD